MKIDVVQEGNIRIQRIRKFEEAGLHPAMLQNVQLARYNIPTPIQQFTLPAIELGFDIIACAQTGMLMCSLRLYLANFSQVPARLRLSSSQSSTS